jgi:hypothetical protein
MLAQRAGDPRDLEDTDEHQNTTIAVSINSMSIAREGIAAGARWLGMPRQGPKHSRVILLPPASARRADEPGRRLIGDNTFPGVAKEGSDGTAHAAPVPDWE